MEKLKNNSGKDREKIGKKGLFPSISRVITDPFDSLRSLRVKKALKLWLMIFAIASSITFFASIILIGFDFYKNLGQKEIIAKERQKLAKEVSYWKGIVNKYGDYRDAYFQLAVLEYKLGESNLAKNYLQKIFELDPNFEEGRKLEKILSN